MTKKQTIKKPWSITTTIRNPERLKGIMAFFENFDNQTWDKEKQIEYQISLIKDRLYGCGSAQFYNGLSKAQIELLDDATREISFEEAKEIFVAKKFKDPAMRGRQSINPLKKFGFIIESEKKKLKVTDLGEKLLTNDADIGYLIFHSFLKWQIHNPIARGYKDASIYNIKPFIGTMHLINLVNQKEVLAGRKAKGISKQEFCLFVPTLLHYDDIENYAEKIIELRKNLAGKNKSDKNAILRNYENDFALEFIEGSKKNLKKFLNGLKDYGDNTIRYFRLTGYFHIRGNGFYIDLEPRRKVEIESLLKADDASAIDFKSAEDYQNYLSNLDSYPLPWQNKESYNEIIKQAVSDIRELEKSLNLPQQKFDTVSFSDNDNLENYVADLRKHRKKLQDDIISSRMQKLNEIEKNTLLLRDIRKQENQALLLEKLSAYALYALNDAKEIKPNYPVGDDNEPTNTAPGNMADIECFYRDFNAICEVTMLTNRNQWYHEGQPVMRHLRDFEKKHADKECYCLFIAPSIHTDTLNTFWISVKYEYEGRKQKIIPISIKEFTDILDFLVTVKQSGGLFQQQHIRGLYDSITQLSDSSGNSSDWKANIPEAIETWKNTFEL